jgi:hypothetical protein
MKSTFYIFFTVTLLVGPFINSSERLEFSEASDICLDLDYDGVIAKDVHWSRQLWAVKNILPWKTIASGLWYNAGTIGRFVRHWGFYDNSGNQLVGHCSHIELFSLNDPNLNNYHDVIITALAKAEPIYVTIDIVQKAQEHGARVVIWTNNDEEMFKAKLDYLNQRLQAEGRKPFVVDGYFVIGCSDVENASSVGKPKFEYFKKAWAYTQKIIGPGNWKHYFIDDKMRNIEGLRRFAEKAGAPITAIHRSKNDATFIKKCAHYPFYYGDTPFVGGAALYE